MITRKEVFKWLKENNWLILKEDSGSYIEAMSPVGLIKHINFDKDGILWYVIKVDE